MRSILLAIPICSAVTSAGADELLIDFHGFSARRESNVPCSVIFSVDERQFMTDVDDLKKLGALNNAVTPEDLKTKPFTIMFATSFVMMSNALKVFYTHSPDIDRCDFEESIVASDKDGHAERVPAAKFAMDRITFNKIDWKTFAAVKLPQTVIEFTLQRELDLRASQEPE